MRRPFRPELFVLAALFMLTAAFGRSFSKLELVSSWLHPTEVLLVVALALALVSARPADWMRRMKATRALIPLLVLWLFGAIATLRGLHDWGFSNVLHDIGLVEYSVLVPLLALIVRDRLDLRWFSRVIALSGVVALAVYALTRWQPSDWDLSGDLQLIMVASGMYFSLYAAWVAARVAAGARVAPWHYLVVVFGLALTILGESRAAWLAVLAALIIPLIFAPAGRRLLSIGVVGALLGLGVGASMRLDVVHIQYSVPNPPALASWMLTKKVTPHRTGGLAVPRDHVAGNAPSGNAPLGNAPSGNAPSGNAPSGNAPSGNAPSGNAPLGNGPAESAPANTAPADVPAESSDGPQPSTNPVAGEIAASFDDSAPGGESSNASWRLAIWKFVIEGWAHKPVFGVGFGAPTNFEWNGNVYDARTGNPLDPFDVTGPHNSFLDLLYRTGLPGFLALIALMFLAVRGLVPVAWRGRGEDRALAIWLLAALAATSIVASFAVALEGPYMGIFFWAVLGLGLLAPSMLTQRQGETESET